MSVSNHLPNDIKFALVKSLYEHKSVLLVGWAIHCLSLATAFVSSGYDYTYPLVGFLITLIIAGRYYDMSRFEKRFQSRSTEKIEVIRGWETRYIIGTLSVSSTLAALSSYAIWENPTSLPAIICLCLQFGSLISIVGRNFGSGRNVAVLAVINGLPPCLAYVCAGLYTNNLPITAAGLLLIPSVIITDNYATFIRQILVSSILAEKKANIVNGQFEAAVANLPVGMVMVDDHNRIVTINQAARNIIGIPAFFQCEDRAVEDVMEDVRKIGRYKLWEFNKLKASIHALIEGSERACDIETKDKRVIHLTAHVITPSTDRRASKKQKFSGAVLICEDITQRKKEQIDNWRNARYDALSQLPNRRYLMELVKKAVDGLNDRMIAFCQFDVDGFKTINDTMGHEAGDEVIMKVGEKMLELQNADNRIIVARLGGDEFAVIYKNLLPHEDVSALYNHVFQTLCSEYTIKGKKMMLRCSGGVTVSNARDFSLDEIMHKADYVLYKVKHNPNRLSNQYWGLFNGLYEQQFSMNVELRDALKQALRNEELSVAYQPVFDTDGQSIDYCEALVRWDDAVLGSIPPQQIIQAAEDLGLMQALTKSVLSKACFECASWGQNVGVAVNVASQDLHQPDFVETIKTVLEQTQLHPSRLILEVHEKCVIKNFKVVAEALEQIAGLGVRIAIDDFGNGYSILNYVKKLPISKVKIDRSFSKACDADEKSKQPLEALVKLSTSLDLEVVVEGIETDDQLKTVMTNKRVKNVQGYLLGRPVSADVIREQIEISKRGRGEVVPFGKRST